VTAAWCFEDEQTKYARHLLRRSQEVIILYCRDLAVGDSERFARERAPEADQRC